MESAHPDLITPHSPTQRVGASPLEELKKTQHVSPMLSPDPVADAEEVLAFDKRVRRELGREVGQEVDTDAIHYTVEPKYDGLAVELIYGNGIFTRRATMGDGMNE